MEAEHAAGEPACGININVEAADDEELACIIDAAAADGDHEALTRLHAIAMHLFSCQLTSKLAWAGHTETLQFLQSLSPPCPIHPVASLLAIEAGRDDVVRWLVDHGHFVYPNAHIGLNTGLTDPDNMPLLEWVYAHTSHRMGPYDSVRFGREAVSKGSLAAISWLVAQSRGTSARHMPTFQDWSDMAHRAAESGHIAILRLLRDEGMIEGSYGALNMTCRAACGDWDVLNPSEETQRSAARRTSLGMSMDLLQAAVSLVATISQKAAQQGRLDMLQSLASSHGPKVLANCKMEASVGGASRSVVYAGDCVSRLDPQPKWHLAFNAAIQNADLQMLEWLRKHWFVPSRDPTDFQPIGTAHSKVVPWMAAHLPHQSSAEISSNGLLIYLAEKSWSFCDQDDQGRVQAARAAFCAFYGCARWLSKQQLPHATLGSLSQDILQKIACEAQVEFCEYIDDTSPRPASKLKLPGPACSEEDSADSDSSEGMDIAYDGYESCDSCTSSDVSCGNSLELEEACQQLSLHHEPAAQPMDASHETLPADYVPSYWLARYLEGPRWCNEHRSEDPDWRMDACKLSCI